VDSRIIAVAVIAVLVIGFLLLNQPIEKAPEPIIEPPVEPEPGPPMPEEENKTCPTNVTPEPEPEPIDECQYECCSNSDCGGIEICCSNECVECCSDLDCLEGTYCEDTVCVEQKTAQGVASFDAIESDICTDGGKPIVRMFSTSTCPHCRWITPAFDAIVVEYGDRIKFYHWYLDDEDNALTSVDEGDIPRSELEVFWNFNPRNSVPTFVFGCKYYRAGTEYEDQDNIKR